MSEFKITVSGTVNADSRDAATRLVTGYEGQVRALGVRNATIVDVEQVTAPVRLTDLTAAERQAAEDAVRALRG